MLNIDELIIIYIILNYQINKQIILSININWIIFEFVISNPFIIRVMFGLTNTVKKPIIDMIHEHELPPLSIKIRKGIRKRN